MWSWLWLGIAVWCNNTHFYHAFSFRYLMSRMRYAKLFSELSRKLSLFLYNFSCRLRSTLASLCNIFPCFLFHFALQNPYYKIRINESLFICSFITKDLLLCIFDRNFELSPPKKLLNGYFILNLSQHSKKH